MWPDARDEARRIESLQDATETDFRRCLQHAGWVSFRVVFLDLLHKRLHFGQRKWLPSFRKAGIGIIISDDRQRVRAGKALQVLRHPVLAALAGAKSEQYGDFVRVLRVWGHKSLVTRVAARNEQERGPGEQNGGEDVELNTPQTQQVIRQICLSPQFGMIGQQTPGADEPSIIITSCTRACTVDCCK